MSAQFDLDAFKAFVASKPAEETYDWLDTHNCAFCQFGRDVLGFEDARAGARYVYDKAAPRGAEVSIPLAVSYATLDKPYTFGALASRLDSLPASRGMDSE